MSTTKLPPITALKALEPRPGGHWTVQGQEGDAISLSYVLNGAEAMTFDLRQCKTEEDVRKFCSSFVYEYTDNGMITSLKLIISPLTVLISSFWK
jgi:hypothetical protein